jgi:hypothetical protein
MANFKWSVQNNTDLTLASTADPWCTQVWSAASFSGSKVVLKLKTGDAKKVTRTPATYY